MNDSDFVFVSVPTPSFESGEINLDILDECLRDIYSISRNEKLFLVRSTVVLNG